MVLFASPITSNCLQTFSTKTEFQIEVYTTISNHDNNAHTLRRTATIETLSRTIFQFRLLRGDAAHTRHRCVRLTALSELTDRFPFDSRARMDKAARHKRV